MEALIILLVLAALCGLAGMGASGSCKQCGRRIRKRYTRCYRCHRALKRGGWHDPENLPTVAERDAQLGRSAFYVYVLDTDYGQYVGHSANIRARLNAHTRGEVPSTAGGKPSIIWRSHPCSTRAGAMRFEAALKSWRDNRKDKFAAVTGLAPVPFRRW
ncbi:MAG: GIY-YIG nuclease family protein [Gammaproteobacteria bacterium]